MSQLQSKEEMAGDEAIDLARSSLPGKMFMQIEAQRGKRLYFECVTSCYSLAG